MLRQVQTPRRETDPGSHDGSPGIGGTRFRLPPTDVCIQASRKSLFCKLGLDCGSQEFWDRKLPLRAGTPRKVGRVSARTMGIDKFGEVTWPMKFYTGPTKSAKAIQCQSGQDDESKVVTVIPKDVRLLFLARTSKKQRIGKYRAYWYYVRPVADEARLSCDPVRGWIYGALMKWEK